mgnify:CR=1 FL=1
MQEREPLNIATIAAETMYNLWEMEYAQTGHINLDGMMRRLRDLSAYSLTHAEILEQREGVELLALGMFFGANSNPAFQKNQSRLHQLSPETIDYQGQPELIQREIALRKKGNRSREEKSSDSFQLRLL